MAKNKFLQSLRRNLTFNLIVNILTLIGLLLAIITFRMNSKMISVLESFQTQTINKGFPDNIPEIIKLLEKAEEKIEIYTDFVAYGNYSAPEKSIEYMNLLKTKMHNASQNPEYAGKPVEFYLYVYNDSLYRSAIEKQFNNVDINDILKSAKYKDFSDFLCKRKSPLCDTFNNIKSKEDFIRCSFEDELENRKDFLKNENNFHFTELSEEIPCFMWFVDGREAIISFPSYISFAEYSIKTFDKSLITVFTNMFKAKINEKTNKKLFKFNKIYI
jgi:hypothetical protein